MFINEQSLETQSVVTNCTNLVLSALGSFWYSGPALGQCFFFTGESSVVLGDCPRVPLFSNYCKSHARWCNNHVLN